MWLTSSPWIFSHIACTPSSVKRSSVSYNSSKEFMMITGFMQFFRISSIIPEIDCIQKIKSDTHNNRWYDYKCQINTADNAYFHCIEIFDNVKCLIWQCSQFYLQWILFHFFVLQRKEVCFFSLKSILFNKEGSHPTWIHHCLIINVSHQFTFHQTSSLN